MTGVQTCALPISFWIKEALRSAVERDCVDAATDAKVLAKLLCDRQDRALARAALGRLSRIGVRRGVHYTEGEG